MKKSLYTKIAIFSGIVIALIIAANLVDPPLFKGLIGGSISPVTKEIETTKLVEEPILSETIVSTDKLEETKLIEPVDKLDGSKILDEELKEEDIRIVTESVDSISRTDFTTSREADSGTEESDEEETLEFSALPVQVVQATPPQISLAYLNRLDSNSPYIYGEVNADQDQVVMIFRLTNSGSLSAYLKEFGTMHTYQNIGCTGTGYCNHLASEDGQLVKLNYDNNGNYIDWLHVGLDNVSTSLGGVGFYSENELTNKAALEIPGNSDVYFAILNDTQEYFIWGNYDSISAQAFLDTTTMKFVDNNGQELSIFSIAPDTITPGVMVYK